MIEAELKYSDKSLCQCHLVKQKFRTDWLAWVQYSHFGFLWHSNAVKFALNILQ
jgi:hypothetical protein